MKLAKFAKRLETVGTVLDKRDAVPDAPIPKRLSITLPRFAAFAAFV